MKHERNRICLKVWGNHACFYKTGNESGTGCYDVMTPSAARGILEAIYWKPQIRWIIESIQVLNPIRFTNVRRNELGNRGPAPRTLKGAMEE